MHFMISLLLFSLACNLDTILLAAGYGLRGLHLSAKGALVIAVVTTAITSASLALGQTAFQLLVPGRAEVLGGAVLVGMGLWTEFDWLRRLGSPDDSASAGGAGQLLSWLSLSFALGINNAGAGLAAGISGLSPLWAGIANFIITLAFLPLGHRLGKRAGSGPLARCAAPLSGALFLLLGLFQCLS